MLATPALHSVIDGSGTVKGAQPRGPERLDLGARFGMEMNVKVDYKILNTVCEFEEGRRIAWRHFYGHIWRYILEPATDDAGNRRDPRHRTVGRQGSPGQVLPPAGRLPAPPPGQHREDPAPAGPTPDGHRRSGELGPRREPLRRPAPSPRTLEVESLASFDRLVAAGAVAMRGWHAQSLDLRGRKAALDSPGRGRRHLPGLHLRPRGGGQAPRHRGALIFPRLEGVPFDRLPGRGCTRRRNSTQAWKRGRTRNCRMRWCISGASARGSGTGWTPPWLRRCMTTPSAMPWRNSGGRTSRRPDRGGGDGRARRTTRYAGVRPGSGAGPAPGAQRAAGGHRRRSRAPWKPPTWAPTSATSRTRDFEAALAALEAVPGFRPSVSAWAREAAAVVERYPAERRRWESPRGSTGTSRPTTSPPTSPNTSPTPSARRSCWSVCDGGIIFLPGAAGTVQEIFQDACENYYSAREAVTPDGAGGQAVLGAAITRRGRMLRKLAAGRAMEDRIFLVDSVAEALAVLRRLGGPPLAGHRHVQPTGPCGTGPC